MNIIYSIKGSLTDTLSVAEEFESITGMIPEAIDTGNGLVNYSKSDFSKLKKGDLSELDYLVRHQKVANID